MHDVMARHVEHGGVPGLVTLISRRHPDDPARLDVAHAACQDFWTGAYQAIDD
jgi:hypothetical protein